MGSSTMYQHPVSPSPYEQMVARQTSKVGRPTTLSDYQREGRRRASVVSLRRAITVLKDRHRDEYNALCRAERAALAAMIDKEYKESQEFGAEPRDLYTLIGDKKA